MLTDALPLQEPWKLSVAEVSISLLPLDCTLRFCDIIPLTLPLSLELILALVVVKFPSVTDPEPLLLTTTHSVASPESTLTPPLPRESIIKAAGVVKLPRTTTPDPLLDTDTFRVACTE